MFFFEDDQTTIAPSTKPPSGSYIDGEWDLKWEDSGDSTIFTFSTKLDEANVWSAFALSKDKKMVIY